MQLSVVQTFESLQLSAVPAVHTAAWQVSAPLQKLPSAQLVPFARGAFWQPDVGLQLSVVQAFESLQLSAVPAAHVPLWQVSAPLHTVVSAHDVPFVTAVFRQPKTGSQLSVVQTFESLQFGAVPGAHVASRQISGPLQKLPSEQPVPFVTGGF